LSQNQEDNNQPTAAWTTLLNSTDEDTKVIRIGSGDQSTAMIFKRVPAALEGFPMGSRSMDDARPVTRVVIEEPYWMAAFPTTQLQWQVGLKEFKAAGFSEYKTLANLYPGFTGPYLPMERINWTDCQTWIECFNRLPQVQELLQKDSPTPQSFGLPYECEWEWACRAVRGTDGRYQACTWEFNGLNHFGDGEPALEKCGWFADNSERSTHRVGQKDPNPLGLYDMHGNVWEWCTDRAVYNYSGYWDGITMQQLISVNSTGDKRHRVIRGGGWGNSARWCQSAIRDWWRPDLRYGVLGFRVGLFPGPNRAQSSKAQADSEQRREAETLQESAESQREGFSSISLPPRSGRNF
jgi:formylglycine-generating enzyme required for sulfatase activity